MFKSNPLRRASALGLAAVMSAAIAGSMPAPAQAADDPLLAPSGRCTHDTNTAAEWWQQTVAMGCLINHARAASGLPRLRQCEYNPMFYACMREDPAWKLQYSAHHKAWDVRDCPRPWPLSPKGKPDPHRACDRDSALWPQIAGYPFRYYGEIITYGSPSRSAREGMAAWLDSPPHREIILNSAPTEMGVGIAKGGPYGGDHWVAHLAAR